MTKALGNTTTPKQYKAALERYVRNAAYERALSYLYAPFNPDRFIAAVLEAMPPPDGISRAAAEAMVIDIAETALNEAAQSFSGRGEVTGRLHRLAKAAGCPPGRPVLPFLIERGLVRMEGRNIAFLSPDGPRPIP